MSTATQRHAAELLRRATMLLNDRALVEGEAVLTQAECAGAALDECAGARWFLAMLHGDMEAAWCASDVIRARGAPDPHRFWNGEAIAGQRVMVRCLHGFGDAVQMLRLLPLLRARAGYVMVQVAPELVPLVGCLPGADEVISWAGSAAGATEPAWDVQVELMELPYVLRLQAGQLPYATKYLRLPAETAGWAAKCLATAGAQERMSIGVVWAAGSWNPSRSVPVTCFSELLQGARAEGVGFWSLQGTHANAEGAELFASGLLRDGSPATKGVLALAATIAEMDLVITVDTLAAHLAGALGVPVWVLLEARADWRWMHDRDDSPWYPSMRLFRLSGEECWPALLLRVQQALAARLAIRNGHDQEAASS